MVKPDNYYKLDSDNIYYQYKLISLFAASIILSCTRKANIKGMVSNLRTMKATGNSARATST